jgi:hypothetical protein
LKKKWKEERETRRDWETEQLKKYVKRDKNIARKTLKTQTVIFWGRIDFHKRKNKK